MIDNQLQFFRLKADFKDNGESRTHYTNNRQEYEDFIASWGHLSDLQIDVVRPTSDQTLRLELLKEIPEAPGLHLSECTMYVQHGVVSPDAPEWLVPLRDSEINLTYYRKIASEDLAQYRYDQEGIGVEFQGVEIDSAREARKIFDGVYADLKNGVIHKTEWKGKNGFISITRGEAEQIQTLLSSHISACFYAEKMILEEISTSEDPMNLDLPTLFTLYYEECQNMSVVPWFITMRQAHLYLTQHHLIDQVEAALNSLPSPNKEFAQVEWKTSTEVHRYRHFVVLLTHALGWTDEQTDTFFIEAAHL